MTQFVSNTSKNRFLLLIFCALMGLIGCSSPDDSLVLKKDTHIVLVGNNLGARMMNYGHFETEMQLRYPDSLLYIRNMCKAGNTPAFRPHSARETPWPFPGADELVRANGFTEHWEKSSGWLRDATQGHFETPDEWLTMLKTDIIIAFFGYAESFSGPEGLENYQAELNAFIEHTLTQKYNGSTPPQLALVSPIAFEDLSDRMDLPNGEKENQNLQLYTSAMKEVAARNNVLFIDAFKPSQKWYRSERADMTNAGFQLNDLGYQKLAKLLVDGIFGKSKNKAEAHRELVKDAVLEKNWFWHNDFKIPNGVHVYGRRYDPYGPENYPFEIAKIREMTAIRDQAIWDATKGNIMDLAKADANTKKLPEIKTNYTQSDKNGTPEYLYGDDALAQISVAPGYKVALFASEEEFNDLANPVQMSFDNKGRLWVGVMPSYPHYKPGDSKPNDKLLILEDTDGDNKADKQTVFADGLHLVPGFELAPEGVYISQGPRLILLKDTDGDDKADVREIVFEGFDDHDTHHAISGFCADPSGAVYMGEGLFLHTNVETAYGPVRGTNGGIYRYSPQRHHLERTAQIPIPNPWGIAFDDWGQDFFLSTSNPDMTWLLPGSIKPRYGEGSPKPKSLVPTDYRVRPTSGLEIVSSRHFPDEVQGDMLINNTIGFLGTIQHAIEDDPESAGYNTKYRQNLLSANDKNFRPVDLEFAPDGSLYIVDWHNVLIGHMQHNARDPLRDHVHGRIYRVTYPSRPLVKPAKVHGATIAELLDNLKLPEYRTRYRTRRELRARKAHEVLDQLGVWVQSLDKNDPKYEHHLLEALWVSWGLNQIDKELLEQVLQAKDFRARAAGTRVVRYNGHQLENQATLLMKAAKDESPRVRMEAMIAASWLDKEMGLPIVEEVQKKSLDQWMDLPYQAIIAHYNDQRLEEKKEALETTLQGKEKELFAKGLNLYRKEGYCGTCHQEDGKGLTTAGFPPLAASEWVIDDEERLIKLTLKGLMGPIEVNGKKYPGQVPMTQFGGMMNDEEVAAVLTYVRNSFGNKASAVSPEKVKTVREQVKDKEGFYTSEELLQEHPFKVN